MDCVDSLDSVDAMQPICAPTPSAVDGNPNALRVRASFDFKYDSSMKKRNLFTLPFANAQSVFGVAQMGQRHLHIRHRQQCLNMMFGRESDE